MDTKHTIKTQAPHCIHKFQSLRKSAEDKSLNSLVLNIQSATLYLILSHTVSQFSSTSSKNLFFLSNHRDHMIAKTATFQRFFLFPPNPGIPNTCWNTSWHSGNVNLSGVDWFSNLTYVLWQTIKTNVIGTLNMLGLAKRVGARLEPSFCFCEIVLSQYWSCYHTNDNVQQDFAYINFWSLRRSSCASSGWKLLGKCQPNWYVLTLYG